MGSFRSPKRAFSESDLTELEWVLEAVYGAVQPPDEETRAMLRRTLFLYACNGISDPDILRDRLIARAARSAGASKARNLGCEESG
jgi:hypothetical protein